MCFVKKALQIFLGDRLWPGSPSETGGVADAFCSHFLHTPYLDLTLESRRYEDLYEKNIVTVVLLLAITIYNKNRS